MVNSNICIWCELDADEGDFDVMSKEAKDSIDKVLEKLPNKLMASVDRGYGTPHVCKQCGCEFVMGQLTVDYTFIMKKGKRGMRV